MNELPEKIDFLAVLIYEDATGWRCEEPRRYSATHPEIAYQLALAEGHEQRYGRKFLGLSHLQESDDEEPLISRSQKGDARELIAEKEELAVFSDPRWQYIPCDEDDLAEALCQPALLFEIGGLKEIPWHQYTDAYGSATDVPRDIQRLASSDSEIRKRALWELFGSIYHQGTTYPATSMAVPFLLQIALDRRLPDRPKVCELLHALADSCAFNPETIRQTWAWRREHFGETYSRPTEEMADEQLKVMGEVRQAFLNHMESLQSLQSDNDPEVSKWAAAIVGHVTGGDRPA